MKRILFFNLLMLSFITGVNADAITFNELPDKLKESLTYEEFLEEGITCDIVKDDDSLDITCDLKSEGKYTTHFDYDGSVLSYESSAHFGSIQKTFDSLWILQMTDNVNGIFGVANDLSEEDALRSILKKINDVNNDSTFSINIERGNTIDSGDNNTGDNDNTGTGSGDTNIGNNNNTGTGSGDTNTGNNDNNVVENPQTGNIVIFVVVVVMFGCILSFILYNKYLSNFNRL